jgi:hypothetical protein
MQSKILTIAIIVVLSACKNSPKAETQNNNTATSQAPKTEIKEESFKTVDLSTIEKLNSVVSSKKFKTVEEIMNNYKPNRKEAEGNYTYTITQKDIDKTTKEITLIEDGLLDDSIAGEKTVMTINIENGIFKVLSIKENHKCYPNRGHETWGAENCH